MEAVFKKHKISLVYQVIMHYRQPFYLKINSDKELDLKIYYTPGKRDSKLRNVKVSPELQTLRLFTFRIQTFVNKISLPFSPFLFFHHIYRNPKIVFSEGASSLINALISFLYCKLFRKKFIWWSLGTLENKQQKGFRKFISIIERFIEKKSDAIFTYSTQGENFFLKNGVDHDKIFKAINVVDTTEKIKLLEIVKLNQDFVKYDDCFNIGFIGTITKEKNIELVIEAVRIINVRKTKRRFILHIIGDGHHLEVITNIVKEMMLEDIVILHGRMDNGGYDILSNCDVFVLPGLGGLALCDAMINSLPIICGRADGTERDLVDETNGYIIEELNVQNLIDKIEILEANEELRLKMGANSYKRITNQYSFENYYNVFKNMINYLVK